MSMRRTLLALACFAMATTALAASPYFLDRNGVLWSGTSAPEGLVLTGKLDDETVVQTVVPYALGLAGTSDTQIQVAADELTGKVAVVWQRNWSSDASEIIVAVWNRTSWERIVHLTTDIAAHGRNPVIKLTQITTPASTDGGGTETVSDSYLHVVWWEGVGGDQHASYALLCLTAPTDDTSALLTRDLDTFIPIGLACTTPPPPEVLEHPLFASQHAQDQALVLFGSQKNCLFDLLEIHFSPSADTAINSTESGLTAIAQRRRHMPIFGVRKVFATSTEMPLDGARMIIGANLNPVVYRVIGSTLEYVTSTDTGWSPRRTLAVKDGLSLDQAIPLVENLAR